MARVPGTSGDDLLTGDPREADLILGYAGDDTLFGDSRGDTLDGGEGNDSLTTGPGGLNVLRGGAGDDTLMGVTDDIYSGDLLDGGDGADLVVGDYYDTLRGGLGDDTIEASAYSTSIDGGAGIDRLRVIGELYLVDLKNVEILETSYVFGTVAQLENLDRIEAAGGADFVELRIGAGVLDLSDELGNLAAHVSASGTLDLTTGSGDDVISASGTVDGAAGNDTIEGDEDARLFGGLGDDSLSSRDDDDLLDGGEGDDTLSGALGNDTLLGGAGDDLISTDSRQSVEIDAGAGDDEVRVGGYGATGSVEGGEGVDRIAVSGDVSKLTITGFESLSTFGLARGTAEFFEGFSEIVPDHDDKHVRIELTKAGTLDLSDQLNGDAHVKGSDGDDVLVTGAGEDLLIGGKGADSLYGGTGADRFILNSGSDLMVGGGGDDTFEIGSNLNATVHGGAGVDTLLAQADITKLAMTDVEILNAFGGYTKAMIAQLERFDRIVAERDGESYGVSLSLGDSGDLDLSRQLAGQDARIVGSKGDDTILSSDGDDSLDGGNGDDRIDAGGGDDSLSGGDGDDTLIGGAGLDRFEGSEGDDIYVVDDARERIEEYNGYGFDTVKASVDFELSRELEALQLTGSRDISGTGTRFGDVIAGNKGKNLIEGESGADTLSGGLGADTLVGGWGDDAFLFASKLGKGNVDHIADFRGDEDDIWLGGQPFSALNDGKLAESAFKDIATGKADADDRILYDSKSGRLYFDADGDGAAKKMLFAILDGAKELGYEDFVVV